MAIAKLTSSANDVVPDLLPPLEQSGLLAGHQIDAIREKIQQGHYPADPILLAATLVDERVLTQFQARRLVKGKTKGLVIDRYVILDRIGEGAMGRVFRGRHRLMDRTVAIKILSPAIASRPDAITRFHQEMRIVGMLDHHNVVRAFDASLFDGIPYIVMEYVPGETLGEILMRRGPLPAVEVIDDMLQVLSGLGHAHDQGVFHRDVKPSNLLRDRDGTVKILDLGLGAFRQRPDDAPDLDASTDGFAVGTADYISPEQARGRAIDGRSDLYSLGCTMYRLLTGRFPFPGESKAERVAARLQGRPTPIAQFRPDLPPALVRVLDRLMARRPEDRFESAAAAAEALRDPSCRVADTSGAHRPPTRQAPDAAVGTTIEPSEPSPFDWSCLEETILMRSESEIAPARPPASPTPPATPDGRARQLGAHRKRPEEFGQGTVREAEYHYYQELARLRDAEIVRLNRALESGGRQGTTDDVPSEVSSWSEWAGLLCERSFELISDPPPALILIFVLFLAVSLGTAYALILS